MITKQDIEKLAELARLKLTEAEAEKMQTDIGSILLYVDQLKEVHETTATTIVGSNRNVMREDIPQNAGGSYTRALVDSAPAHDGDFVKVKKIL
jgi:aspartyl-tRNA(Asn)/glutamyl-tRNA(Gln) amidotransferase subunit C